MCTEATKWQRTRSKPAKHRKTSQAFMDWAILQVRSELVHCGAHFDLFLQLPITNNGGPKEYQYSIVYKGKKFRAKSHNISKRKTRRSIRGRENSMRAGHGPGTESTMLMAGSLLNGVTVSALGPEDLLPCPCISRRHLPEGRHLASKHSPKAMV